MQRNLSLLFAFQVIALTAVLAVPGAAWAQATERLGDFGDWSAFRAKEGDNFACYVSSIPIKAEGKYKKRGEIYAFVTHRPADGRRDEVSFFAGYTHKKDSVVKVKIGSTTKELFTQGSSAWVADKQTDQELIQAMIKGSSMIVRGTSKRGTATKDTYSLRGFTKAYNSINKACPK